MSLLGGHSELSPAERHSSNKKGTRAGLARAPGGQQPERVRQQQRAPAGQTYSRAWLRAGLPPPNTSLHSMAEIPRVCQVGGTWQVGRALSTALYNQNTQESSGKLGSHPARPGFLLLGFSAGWGPHLCCEAVVEAGLGKGQGV